MLCNLKYVKSWCQSFVVVVFYIKYAAFFTVHLKNKTKKVIISSSELAHSANSEINISKNICFSFNCLSYCGIDSYAPETEIIIA